MDMDLMRLGMTSRKKSKRLGCDFGNLSLRCLYPLNGLENGILRLGKGKYLLYIGYNFNSM
jgi:hypothetical protein